MTRISYYSEEKPYWDTKARRFEKGAKPVARYRMPCVALTFPYTPLTWLMANFISSFYLSDRENWDGGNGGFWRKKKSADTFWKRAFYSGIYQYEMRVNKSSNRKTKGVLANIIEIYRMIAQEGFNTAKLVPVTENIKGEIVPLKGAKRIASLIALGEEWVPVLEYDRTTLSQIPSEQVETGCINHSELIFGQLGDLAEVQSLKMAYSYMAQMSRCCGVTCGRASLRRLVIKEGRMEQYERLIHGNIPLTRYVDELELVAPPSVAVVIGHEIEYVLWLLKRTIRCAIIVTDVNMAGKVERITRGTNETKLYSAISSEELDAIVEKEDCKEIWCSPKGRNRMNLTDNHRLGIRPL